MRLVRTLLGSAWGSAWNGHGPWDKVVGQTHVCKELKKNYIAK